MRHPKKTRRKKFPGFGQGHGPKLRVTYEKMRITEQNINGFFINSLNNAIIFTAKCRNCRGSQVNISIDHTNPAIMPESFGLSMAIR